MPDRRAYDAAAAYAGLKYDGLEMFRAMPNQIEILQSTASETLVAGSNRAGKSLILAVRFAAIARGMVVHGIDGEDYDPRLEHQHGRPLLMWIIAQNWDKIGDTIYRLLFQPGAYDIVRDKVSNQWRAFNPYVDQGREHERKPSWPLIPMDEVKGGFSGFSWEERKGYKFKRLEMVNGTKIRAYASTGEVATGDPVDEIWIDEKFMISSHYPEWQARIMDKRGRIWLSTIHYADPALFEIRQRAQEQAQEVADGEREFADVRCINLYLRDNPFLTEEAKKTFADGLSDEERKLRVEGEPIIGSLVIYQDFSRTLHCAIANNPATEDELSAILRERNGQPPQDWTRELVVDPGTLRPYVLFGAVPPPSLWRGGEPFFVVYDELYEPRLPADALAAEVAQKLGGYSVYRGIIDAKAGQQTPMGFSRTVQRNYEIAFGEHGIRFEHTNGPYFIPGDPNFEQRSKKVEQALLLRKCGMPQLRLVIDRCRALVRQLEGNLYSTVKAASGEELPTKKPARQKDDARESIEMWLSRHPQYVKPTAPVRVDKPIWERWTKLTEQFKKRKQPDVVHIGSGSAT